MSGGTPAPKKLKLASDKIAEENKKVACTITGAKVLGAMCLNNILVLDAPNAFAASTY